MDGVPSSVVTAVALSAAAGKNPWVPLGLLFLLAAPESVPALFVEPDLHAQLHDLGPPGLLWGLGITFLVVSVLESLADKLSWVETWLVPVSTSWRPFAAVACAALVGWAATEPAAPAGTPELVQASLWPEGGGVFLLCLVGGATFGWIATVGKTGVRLLLSFVPVPALKLVHSFLDDFFAVAVSFVGFVLADTWLAATLAVLYLLVGLILGPPLARLSLIQLRIGWGIVRKAIRGATKDAVSHPDPPRWVRPYLDGRGAVALPCYAHRAGELGRFRTGWLVFGEDGVRFVTRSWFRTRALAIAANALGRVGLAESATARELLVTERSEAGQLRSLTFSFFPAHDDEVLPLLERGAVVHGLVRVRPDSPSARRNVVGHEDRGRSTRYLPAERVGSLRLQAVVTLTAAIGVGVLTAGVFVPIGAGYVLSPFRRRFLLGLLLSGWLTLCVLGTVGLAWPVAVLYGTLLNVVALRDLTRATLKARIDGFVDRRAFLPPVAGRVWVPPDAVGAPGDRAPAGEPAPQTDGSWRAVVSALAT